MNETTAPTLSALAPETLLNQRYKISHQIGLGGFSCVYAAEDLSTQQSIVIKECLIEGLQYRSDDLALHALHESDEALIAQVKQNALEEAALLNLLTEQGVTNISTFIEAFEQNNSIYIAMTEAKGHDLLSWAESYRAEKIAFPADFLTSILSAVLQILEQVHRLGYFHCDIKPNNILIDDEGVVTLIDFGAARSVEKQHGVDVAISPGFSPPEFYPSHRAQIGAWTDIYMLAALIYNIITGKVPEAADLRAVRDRNVTLAAMPRLLTIYPSALLNSVDKAMSIQANDRFVSAEVWEQAYAIAAAGPQMIRRINNRNKRVSATLGASPSQKVLKARARRVQTNSNSSSGLFITIILLLAAGIFYILHLKGMI